MSFQTECFQTLNLAGTRLCRPDLVSWLIGSSDMLLPRMTITSSSGLSLDGLPKACTKEVVTGLGTSIGIVNVTGLLSTLVSVVAGCLMNDS